MKTLNKKLLKNDRLIIYIMEKQIRYLKTNLVKPLKNILISLSIDDDDVMVLSEHIEEFSQRLVFCLCILVTATVACFTDIRQIVKLFQAPAIGIKFLQFAPGEYFLRQLK